MASYDAFRQKAKAARTSQQLGRRRQRLAIDTSIDPYDIPLAQLNVANPALFKEDAAFSYFTRLREEAPSWAAMTRQETPSAVACTRSINFRTSMQNCGKTPSW